MRLPGLVNAERVITPCRVSACPMLQGRCGYGPRLPLLVISPYARQNYVDHSLTDQSSILRFIEDNWLDGQRIQGSFDAHRRHTE